MIKVSRRWLILGLLFIGGGLQAKIVFRGQRGKFIQFAHYAPCIKYGGIEADLIRVRCTLSPGAKEGEYVAYFYRVGKYGVFGQPVEVVRGEPACAIFNAMKAAYCHQE